MRRAVGWLWMPLAVGACEPQHVETGDLAAIRARGTLRIVAPVIQRDERLRREGHPFDLEFRVTCS